MAKHNTGQPTWAKVKQVLGNWQSKELLTLIGELYRLSATNRDLLHSRSRIENHPMDRYRRVVEKGLCPNVLRDERIDYQASKRAIKEYRSAIGDVAGSCDLLIYFVECGNAHVTQYGDFDPGLLNAIIKSFRDACELIRVLPEAQQQSFKDRLRAEVERAEGLGYGYYDEMAYLYDGAFG